MNQVAELEVRGVTKRFGATLAVEQLSFQLWAGQFLSLLGPSGCGKTTTLRMIAGFLIPDEGQILCRGVDITTTPPYRRDIGLVFQNYALFPHMSVAENVAFGLKMRRASQGVIRDRVGWALDLVRLVGFENRRPHELSGGQQQRVAVARVLAPGAALLLFDEPFSSLDAKLRKDMQAELRELQQRLGIATLHVTHDQEEAMSMSDGLIILNNGRVEQEGTSADIYRNPASSFVAEFMGRCNRLSGRIMRVDSTRGTAEFELDKGGRLEVLWVGTGVPPIPAMAFVRPQYIIASPPGTQRNETNVLRGKVRRLVYLSSITMLTVTLDNGNELLVEFPNSPDDTCKCEAEAYVDLFIPVSGIRVLPGALGS